MKKLTILLLCCGVLVSMFGCGGNTAPPTTSPPTTVSETIITETPPETPPPVTVVELTKEEKVPVPTESKEQKTKPTMTTTVPTTTQPIEETKTIVTSTAEEKATPPIEETVPSTTSPLTESETTETEPPKEEPKTEPIQEPETTPPKFDIHYWVTFAKEYAVSIGLILDSTAVHCWDNPIRAGAHCIYLERDIQSRLNRYAKDEDITDVWIWAECTSDDCYDIYIGYA